MPDCYVHICGIFATVTVLGALIEITGCPDVSKT